MASKFQFITELYSRTLTRLTGNYESWTGFLRAACYNYKCPFDEQVLIYAQRPNATAVLELEKWNKQFGRWVNTGATGIAVIDETYGKGRLKHYFDITDTHTTSVSRPVPVWTMEQAYTERVIETLEATFGTLAEKDTLPDAILSASRNAVADNVQDYLWDLLDCRGGSMLEELDALNVEVTYRRALESSVAYMLMTRLSLPAMAYILPEDFEGIYSFDTPSTINALGIATSDIAEMGLREISRTVMQAQREQFFAKDAQIGYDAGKEQNNAEKERSAEHGSDLQSAGGLSPAEPADAAGAGDAPGQVRGAAETVPDAAPPSAVYQPQDQRATGGASGGDPGDSAADGGAGRGADGEDRGRDGGAESRRPPALDGADEQPEAQRGGSGAERPDLQLISEEPARAGSDALPALADDRANLYHVAAYHHFENGFDDKLDYPTLEEAVAAAQGYVAGTMEADGFAYDGAAVYDADIALKPSEYQKEMVASLAERAEQVRNRQVDSSVDNMLLITNDGRKLALDQRLINPMLPSDPESKAAKCAETVFDIWQRTAEKRSTQMIFCDLSTPKGEGTFSVYDDIRDKLLAMGIPENEIAYIHDAKTEAQKKDLFAKVRVGQVRVLLGSTQRMGAGTNCQQKLIALHHLDCPWRPSDLQQREGRIIRQGNENAEVDIYSYVTEGTFDAYLYQLVERKQKFIAQIMTSKSPVRSAEDVDEQALSYAEIKALASGNPLIKEKMDLDIEVTKLKLLKSSHLSQRYALEDAISKTFPKSLAETQVRLAGYSADIATVKEHTAPNADGFSPMTLSGKAYTEKKAAGAELLAMCQNMLTPEPTQVGSYRGLTLELSFDSFSQEYRLTMIGQLRHMVTLGTDVFGNIQRMDNLLETLPVKEQACREKLSELHTQMETAKAEVLKPFPREEELKTKLARLEELNALLNMDKHEPEVIGDTEMPEEQPPARKTTELER